MTGVALWLLLGGVASAQSAEVPVEPSLEEVASVQQITFGEQLAQAKRMYFAGAHLASLELFEGLEVQLMTVGVRERVGSALGAEALLYLGEVLYILGRVEDSSAAFEKLFDWDSEYPVSPYHHPIEVVRNAERVRAEVKRARQPLPNPVVRLAPSGVATAGAGAGSGAPSAHTPFGERGSAAGGVGPS